jgi:hypothetical protein
VHKGSTQTNKRLKLGFKYKGAKKPSVPWSGAPDCPVCHRTVFGASGPCRAELATLGFLQALSAIIHRTIQCATGLSDVPSVVTATSAMVDYNGSRRALQCATVRGRVRAHRTLNSACPVRHQTVWCHKKTNVPTVNCSKP